MVKRIGFCLAFAALLVAASSLGLFAAPASFAETGVVEELWVRADGEVTWTMHVLFEPAFAGDRAAVADALAAAQGFRQGRPELTSSYATDRPWALSGMPIQVRYNPDFDITLASPASGAPEVTSLLGPLDRAFRAWSAVPTRGLAFQNAGPTTVTGTNCDGGPRDGMNLVRFRSSLPKGVLGRACIVTRATFAGTFTVEFDMEIADDVLWSTGAVTPSTAFDLDSVVLHEMGHAIGLGHSAENAAVMYRSIAPGVNNRAPTFDDVAGIQAMYGVPPTTVPNGSYVAGMNSVVVLGGGTPAGVSARIALDSGRPVTALWVLSSGTWRYYLPSAPAINGGLTAFPGPTAAVLVVLA